MIGHLDCSTGVSGDKFLGAVLDAGAATAAFSVADLSAMVSGIAPEASIEVTRVETRGVSALGVRVSAVDEPPHRTWSDVRTLLANAGLSAPVADASFEVFRRLAEAEAAIHGRPIDEVHFHEVGALDSIVDVVGVCAGLHALGVSYLSASFPATGWGTVGTSHGVLPVPAPATERLLRGFATVPGPHAGDGSAPGELTTPTGAALLTTLATSFGPPPPMTSAASGYGAGTRDIGHPNICRLTVGVPNTPVLRTGEAAGSEHVVLLETNLDHLAPEAVGNATEELLAAGALDVWQTPVVMKKQRAAVVLSVLAAAGTDEALTERMHEVTGTLGIRRFELTRSVLPREVLTFGTRYGPVRAKVAAGTVRPEHDDITRIARETGAPYETIRQELLEEALAALEARERGDGTERP